MEEMGEHIDGGRWENTLMKEMGEHIDEGDGRTH